MRKINPEHLSALMDLMNRVPYFKLLSMKICELGIGYSSVEIDLDGKHLNPFGGIHGGVFSSVIDSAAYMATYCELDEDVGYTSIDLTVNNLSMINRGKIIAEGRSLKIGKSLCLAEATVKDATGRLLAQGSSKLMRLRGGQSVNHAVEAMGCNTLPPKFLE